MLLDQALHDCKRRDLLGESVLMGTQHAKSQSIWAENQPAAPNFLC